MKKKKKWLIGCLLAVLMCLALAPGWIYWTLCRSLPILDGSLTVSGLSATVNVERDGLGIPSIAAENMQDAAFAQGFLHAQDRFFQMDLMRRKPVGTLSELLGEMTLNYDIHQKRHGLSAVVVAAYAREAPKNRALAEVYAKGVNAGLQHLAVKPFEYILLGVEPEPWKAEHCYQVILSMFFELHDSEANQEYHMGLVRESLGQAWSDFLCPAGTSWDAPIQGAALESAPIPKHGTPSPANPTSVVGKESSKPGSNNWAVAGELTQTGSGLLANDMHLGIGNPNTWYRADLRVGGEFRVTGVTLPGVPGVVCGSNGDIAWGFTNSFGDYYDLIPLELNQEGTQYLAPEGWKPFTQEHVTVKIKKATDRKVTIKKTIWGPVDTRGGRPYALAWTAHHPESLNFNLFKVMQAKTVDQVLALASSCGMPPQNLAVVDRHGNVAWTIIGKIPKRKGYSGRFPMSWAQAGTGWDGWLGQDEVPHIKNPAHHRIWTANARVVSGDNLNRIGDGGYDLGARAKQIRDRLFEKDSFSESDFLAIQLDYEARFLATWHTLLEKTLQAHGHSDTARRARDVLQQWKGFAATDSVAYRLVWGCRQRIIGSMMNHFTAKCISVDPDFRSWRLPQSEGPAWKVLQEKPLHLLPAGSTTWEAWLVAQVEAEIREMEKTGPLTEQTWGKRNTFVARHPLAAGIPIIGRWLNSPAMALPGDSHMPRVQGPTFGASERMIVSPGHEDQGIFHMPGGQSSHPLSPFFLKGIDAWALGEATGFLPGPAEHTLILKKAP